MLIASILIIIELTFSFDNAIVNARILMSMSPFLQKLFMTVGILIAVFGMRIIFPILIVMLTAGLSWEQVLNVAFNQPNKYVEILQLAHPSIAAFGGMFLLMLALHFFFDASREIRWLDWVERPLQSLNKRWLPALICMVFLTTITLIISDHAQAVLIAGFVGIVVYLVIDLVAGLFTQRREAAAAHATKKQLRRAVLTGLASFIYLEILDASFSFDGVIGAFAVTSDIILIAAGLGVGALWVRSLTLFIVHRKILHTYRYLEHAAHYVIVALAIMLLFGLFYEISQMYVGIIGIGVIVAAIVSSVKDNRKYNLTKL